MMFGSCIEIWKKRSFQQITTLLINAFTYSTHSAARIPKKENRSVILLNADRFHFCKLKQSHRDYCLQNFQPVNEVNPAHFR